MYSYYEETLKIAISQADFNVPDSNLISKSDDEGEIVKLLTLLLGLTVHCEKSAVYVGRIQALPEVTQKHLKTFIEEVRMLATCATSLQSFVV